MRLDGLRVALVHDWLTGMRGGEKVLEALCERFPAAHLHTLVHVPGSVSPTIADMEIRTSWIQRLPGAPQRFRAYLPLFPSAIESFDLRGYDLVVSCSHCIAKGVLPDPSAVHVAYVFTPMRYVWDLTHEYFQPRRLGRLQRMIGPLMASYLRGWDATSNARVDRFLACSQHVRKRIRRYYGRDASVVYPPVDTEYFTPASTERKHLLVVSALVPYKAVELAIDAVRGLDVPLIIAGEGPERARLEAMAPANVRFTGAIPATELRDLFQSAIAFLLPGEEDFGIAALEAQACGTPVIAYRRGGALETVAEGTSGLFFDEPTPDSLRKAIARISHMNLLPAKARQHALGFSERAFTSGLMAEIEGAVAEFRPELA